MPRLCIASILRARAGECVILLGMKCSSWTVVNQGTSKRAPCCPAGDTRKISVRMANCMAARKLGFIYQGLCCQTKWPGTVGYLISDTWWKPRAPIAFWLPRTILLCLPWPRTTCTFWNSHSYPCSAGMEGSDTWHVSAEFRDLILMLRHVKNII